MSDEDAETLTLDECHLTIDMWDAEWSGSAWVVTDMTFSDEVDFAHVCPECRPEADR